MDSRNALSGFRRSSQVAPLAACDSGIRDKTMGRKRKSSGAPLSSPAPNRWRGRIAENDMSIAGYVLKAVKTARDGLPGCAVGPGDIIVGDRLQAEGERVRVSPAIKPMKNWSKLGQFPSSIKPRKRSRPPLWCLTMVRSGPPVAALGFNH